MRPELSRPRRLSVSTYRSAFTLVELLVVIAIVLILIALLLPTATGMMRVSRTIQCATNLRTLAQAMHVYASQYHGYIPGGPNTTGLPLFYSPFSNANCPDVSQIWDYQAPLARTMGIPFETGGTRAQRIERFTYLMSHKVFSCPDNDRYATAFTGAGGPSFAPARWISYSAGTLFQFLNHETAPSWYTTGQGRAPDFSTPPPEYAPKLNRVGNASRKVFLADGGRFVSVTGASMDMAHRGSYGGSYADVGAWSQFSRAWPRGNAPGNGGGGDDLRLYSFRHGTRLHNAPADRYRMNVAFFDGHVETLGDLEAADPDLWAPRGAALLVTDAHPDVYAKYMMGKKNPYVVP